MKKKKDNKKTIMCIIILILLLMFWLGYRIGKLGYKETTISPNNNFEYNSIILLENDMQKIKNNQKTAF